MIAGEVQSTGGTESRTASRVLAEANCAQATPASVIAAPSPTGMTTKGATVSVATATKPPGEDWHVPANADDVLSQHLLYSNAPQPAVSERGDAVISWYQSDGAALLAWESERFGYGGAFSRPGPTEYLSVRDAPIDSHPIANPKLNGH